jgi:phospholipid/cholesterol/gamma-HCH transport system substrate-binding protein
LRRKVRESLADSVNGTWESVVWSFAQRVAEPTARTSVGTSGGPTVGDHAMSRAVVRPLVGLATVVGIIAVVALAAIQFRGGFAPGASVTLLAERAGLVMYPDAKVQMLGSQVGKVASIEELPDGQAVIHLAMDPDKLHLIPSNVVADISASTVFGAKYVELIPPETPSAEGMSAGQVLDAQHVTVEINTVFGQLTSVLSKIQPDKLNQTLGAIATAFNGRGQQFGQGLSDFDSFLAQMQPHLPALSHDLATAPEVFQAYADAAPDLLKIADNAATTSQTIVDQQRQLDVALLSVIGLADVGTDVVGQNAQPLADVLHLLVPTTDLTREYNAALWCGFGGLLEMANGPAYRDPGIPLLAGLVWASDRYRYPGDMPKVAASGGPQCTGLPKLPYETNPPFVITDTGTNPWKYGNPGIVLNADSIKRLLFGDIDGPPRNTAQIGQPG